MTAPTEISDFQGTNDLDGGSGNDFVEGQGGTLNGGPGNDVIIAFYPPLIGYGSIVNGGPGNDEIHGSSAPDHLNGDAGNDTIHTGEGADTVDGGVGKDTCYERVGRPAPAGVGDDSFESCEVFLVERSF